MKTIDLPTGEQVAVDDQDFELVSQFKWYRFIPSTAKHLCYSRAWARPGGRGTPRFSVLMHRIILSPPRSLVVDHRDGNGLNNTRSNIHVCTYAVNAANRHRWLATKSSGFLGVARTKTGWQAYFSLQGKTTYIGHFQSERAAALARDISILQYETAIKLNFPEIALERCGERS
jgi:hypothetical protein